MTRLSNRQFPMLTMFIDMKEGQYMTEEEAMRWDQRSFRSMLVRAWVSYRPNHGFFVTKEGREAMQEFLSTDIARQNPGSPLTSYFDASAYGLKRKTAGKARPNERRLHAAA